MSQTWKRVMMVVGGAALFFAGYLGGRPSGHVSGSAADPAGEILAALREARHGCAGDATAACYTDFGQGSDRQKLYDCLAEHIGTCEDRFLKARAQAMAGGLPGSREAAR